MTTQNISTDTVQTKKGNEKGIITLEFIFGISVSLSLMIVLFSISLTYVAVEIGQYIAFATARSASAGHLSESTQISMGEIKFNELKQNRAIAGLFSSQSWFRLGDPDINYHSDLYPADSGYHGPFFGVRVEFKSVLLDSPIPLIGKSGAGDGSGFSAFLTGFLTREVSMEECQQFNLSRAAMIMGIDGKYNQGGASSGLADYKSIEDNGC